MPDKTLVKDCNEGVIYEDESLFARIKRRLGIKDGHLICTSCRKQFFNLFPSTICEPCWESAD